jgi:hypothetical protein
MNKFEFGVENVDQFTLGMSSNSKIHLVLVAQTTSKNPLYLNGGERLDRD